MIHICTVLCRSIPIRKFAEFHTTDSVHFEVTVAPNSINEAQQICLVEAFKLESSSFVKETNLHAFDGNGKVIRFDSPLQIIDVFFDVRLDYYQK
jgi:DNA topoisomerase-2